MFILQANKNRLIVRQREPITSGSVNVSPVRFEFSAEWEGLTRTAIFRAGVESRAVLLGKDNETMIPWEVLQQPGQELFCGVYGTQGGHTVLPTIWASLGVILAGASPGEPAQPPTPDLWEQALEGKGDNLELSGQMLNLRSGEKVLSSVELPEGGGEGTEGPPGPQGPKGDPGTPGEDATINGKPAITLVAGQNVTIETADDGTVTISAVGGGSGDMVNLVRAPIGTIVVWSGSVESIPTGWALCDGQDGRPDLRGKFVLGAGGEYNPGAAGGNEEVTLAKDNIPTGAASTPSGQFDISVISSANIPTPVSILPPYFALCYIIKATADPADGVTQEELQAALASKQDTIIPGDGLSKDGDTLNVENPVQGIYTLNQWNALPEEQKASGTYFVDDGQDGGGSGWEVYSTEEQRIGTWINGKPIYRRTFSGLTVSTDDNWHEITEVTAKSIPFDDLVNYNFLIDRTDGYQIAGNSGYYGLGLKGGKVYHFISSNAYANAGLTLTLDYTKTTDPEVSE